MTTQKERELIAEIMSLALDIGAGDFSVDVDYSGHVHALYINISKKGDSGYIYYGEAIYLSGRKEIWGHEQAIAALEEALAEIKKYHPAFDADGVKL